jgi:hypothetical protein
MAIRLSGSFLCTIMVFCACVNLQRSNQSGYAQTSTHSTASGWQKTSVSTDDKYVAPDVQPPSDKKIRLKQLENRISGQREREQYSKALPWFKNDDEKIEFLEVGTYENRQKWLTDHDFTGRAQRTTAQMQELADAQDIALGMPQTLVKKAWGEPTQVDVSGSPEFKNERWRYSKLISTPDGYKPEKKTVYFEGGRVVGWEVE